MELCGRPTSRFYRPQAVIVEKSEVVTAAYSELLRYSVAISVQLERIAYWREELRQARTDWNEASYRAIFETPSGADFEARLRGLKAEYELPPKMHLKSEVQFLVVAVRNAYVMATTIRWAVAEIADEVRCVQRAITAFEKSVPDAVLLRHLHEHMDEVLMGKGDAFKKLPQPEMDGTIALLGDDIGYAIGGKVWSLKEMSTAAKDLVRDVTGCIQRP